MREARKVCLLRNVIRSLEACAQEADSYEKSAILEALDIIQYAHKGRINDTRRATAKVARKRRLASGVAVISLP